MSRPAYLPVYWLTNSDSMAPLVYSSEGQEIRSELWKETMAELSFAQVDTILQEIGI